jgi:hypothetical protein
VGRTGSWPASSRAVDHETAKRKRKDDLADPLRFICMAVPWNWTVIQGAKPADDDLEPKPMTQEEFAAREMKLRRGEMSDFEAAERSMNQEFEEINELLMG